MSSSAKSLTEGPLAKQILLVSLPLVLSNLLQVLFNMSDVAVVGLRRWVPWAPPARW
mgnify:CR=1 FL=1